MPRIVRASEDSVRSRRHRRQRQHLKGQAKTYLDFLIIYVCCTSVGRCLSPGNLYPKADDVLALSALLFLVKPHS